MKYNFIAFIIICSISSVWAQSPPKLDYQAVVRDSTGAFVRNSNTGWQFSILKDSAGGPSVYVETHTDTTSEGGVVNFQIGTGTVVSGQFDSIGWTEGSYFLKSEAALDGSTSYTDGGTTELLSVPYAMYANQSLHADRVTTADSLYIAVSPLGDTLFIGDTSFITLPGLSEANYPPKYATGYVNCASSDTTEIKKVTSLTGAVWMDRNLGASRAATNLADTLAYGGYFQWGRFADGHQCRSSALSNQRANTAVPNDGNIWDGKFIISTASTGDWIETQDSTLWQGPEGANNPCPFGYRLPTDAEWTSEKGSWTEESTTGAYESPLKLPVPGYRWRADGDIKDPGNSAYYWSSSIGGGGSLTGAIGLDSSSASLSVYDRAVGHSVRCIKH